VGDIAFQRKCLKRMKKFMERGGCLILVSHNMDKIRSICTHGVYLDHGQVMLYGDIGSVIKGYVDNLNLQSAIGNNMQNSFVFPSGSTPIVLKSVEFYSPSTATPNTVRFGETATARFTFEALNDIQDVNFGFSVWTEDDVRITSVSSRFVGKTYNINKGRGEVKCALPGFPLLAGIYKFKAAIYDAKTNWLYHGIGYDGNLPTLIVTTGFLDSGAIMIPSFGLFSLDSRWFSHDEEDFSLMDETG